jgi:release factor glutamine methyltransferase
VTAREIRRAATDRLTAAGVASPHVDAALLMAHVTGTSVGGLVAVDDLSDDQVRRYRALVDRRAAREPLQHIVGHVQFGSIELEVGPGVFIPRMETETLWAWALGLIAEMSDPVVVDLCSGSGALALAIADAQRSARVHAVEIADEPMRWLVRNLSRLPDQVRDRVSLHQGDVRDPSVLDGVRADVVVANPPYIPTSAELPIEVVEFDPHLALFGGADGMSVIVPMIGTIASILVAGGSVAIEHDDSTGPDVMAAFADDGRFESIVQNNDLTGRPRFVSARRI